jgi:hypothetical protein
VIDVFRRNSLVAKKKRVNKSQAIRDLWAADPNLGPKEISEKLKEQGITASAQYVSTIKSLDKTRASGGKRAARGRPAKGPGRARRSGAASVDAFSAAIAFVKAAGGMDAARSALATLDEIRQLH